MNHPCRWLLTVLFVPALYLIGWLSVQPLRLFIPDLSRDNLSLIGTVISFISFMLLMPSWVKSRWKKNDYWTALGLGKCIEQRPWKSFLKGVFYAFLLLSLGVFSLLLASSAWQGDLILSVILNAILLGIGVGFAEELIFRGWLWGELNMLIGHRRGIYAQAAIFSLLHARFSFDLFALIGCFVGMFLFGLVLALRRVIDGGSLFGCVGLHGSLVGFWFLFTHGLIRVPAEAPWWIVGPGGQNPNPLVSVVGIFALGMILWIQRNAFAIAGRP